MNRGGGAGGGRGGGAAGGGAAPGAGARTPFNIQGPKFQANGRIRGMTDFQQKKWLERSSVWPDMAANGYIGRKVLGAGAHAIVGVWENTQPLANLPKHVVVKQVSDQQHQTWEALRVESKLLRDILRTNTEHIIKLYKSAYRAGGTGTSAARDPLPFVPGQPWDPTLEVGRMYLEYCPEGDLNSQFENVISAGEDIPEEFIWRFLHCLASALIVLEKGMQDPTPNGPPIAGWAPITHFDIKPDNILIGLHDDNHPRLPTFKLTDFGLALPLPQAVSGSANDWNNWNNKQGWINEIVWRTTPGYTPPEQVYIRLPVRRIGRRSDVWSLGVVLYELMTKTTFQRYSHAANGGTNIDQDTFRNSRIHNPEIPTFGEDLLTSGYSKRLIELVHICLAFTATYRPSPDKILREVNLMLPAFVPVPKKATKVQIDTGISTAPVYTVANHPELAPYTVAESVNGHWFRGAAHRPQSGIAPVNGPNWAVPPEAAVPAVPAFAPGVAPNLNANAWPYQSVLQNPGTKGSRARGN